VLGTNEATCKRLSLQGAEFCLVVVVHAGLLRPTSTCIDDRNAMPSEERAKSIWLVALSLISTCSWLC
jgi:hypothetical protein